MDGEASLEPRSPWDLPVSMHFNCPFCHGAHFSVSDSTISGWPIYFWCPGELLLILFWFYVVHSALMWWWPWHLVILGLGVVWVCIYGGEDSRNIIWIPVLYPHDALAKDRVYLSTWCSNSVVSSLAIRSVISRKGCLDNGSQYASEF